MTYVLLYANDGETTPKLVSKDPGKLSKHLQTELLRHADLEAKDGRLVLKSELSTEPREGSDWGPYPFDTYRVTGTDTEGNEVVATYRSEDGLLFAVSGAWGFQLLIEPVKEV